MTDLVSLRIDPCPPSSFSIGSSSFLERLWINLPDPHAPLSRIPTPTLTHLTISGNPGWTARSLLVPYPALTHLAFTEDPSFGFLGHVSEPAIRSTVTHFQVPAGLGNQLVVALPPSIVHITFGPQRGADLRAVLDRWFERRSREEVGRLSTIVLLGLTEDELVRYYARGAEFLTRVTAGGCEIEFRYASTRARVGVADWLTGWCLLS